MTSTIYYDTLFLCPQLNFPLFFLPCSALSQQPGSTDAEAGGRAKQGSNGRREEKSAVVLWLFSFKKKILVNTPFTICQVSAYPFFLPPDPLDRATVNNNNTVTFQTSTVFFEKEEQ